MKKDELLEELWAAAGPCRRLIGKARFSRLVDTAIASAPVYQLWHAGTIEAGSDRAAAIKAWWEIEVKRSREAQFGPLTWLIVGSIINFIIGKLLEWATRSHSNAVLLAGWNAERINRRG